MLWILPLTLKADPNTNPPIARLSKYEQVESGFFDSSCLAVYWSVQNKGQSNEQLAMAVVFNATLYYNSNPPAGNPQKTVEGMWAGFGWGPSMLNSEFVLAYSRPGSQAPTCIEAAPSRKYAPPVAVDSDKRIIQSFVGSYDGNYQSLICEFVRPTRTSDPINHQTIDINAKTRHIFAFNPAPPKNAIDGWKYWHGEDNRGSYLINYSTGRAQPTNIDDIWVKRTHALGMSIIWLIIFPACIYFTRFFRKVNGWIWIHIGIQAISSIIGVYGFALYIIVNLTNNFGVSPVLNIFPRPHSINGWIMLILVFLQAVLGLFNRLTFSQESWNADRSRFNLIRFAHNWLGRILILQSFVQVGLGLDILYPAITIQFYGAQAWIVYFFLLGFWLIVFAVSEVYYRYRIIKPADKVAFIKGKIQRPDVAEELKPGKNGIVVKSDIKSFTWEDIDREMTTNGQLLVVAQNRYVYRINEWIQSHPGGQIILHAVAGTDITNDYFYESGYDVEQFVPKQKLKSKSKPLLQAGDRSSYATLNPDAPPSISAPSITNMTDLNDEQWQHVIRARRTHVHTRNAISKLSDLMVGELVVNGKSEDGDPLFSDREYRRYALVGSVMETEQGSVTPIFRLKFCLLYPFDARENEPTSFLPGQSIEIQARIDGKYVSRFYTPINGSPTAFEICVKVYSQGVMSSYLARQRPGDRQFKIRGPLGTPLVNPEVPLGPGMSWSYNQTLFIAGGSGLAPCLQLLQTMFLPTYVPLFVKQPYYPQEVDELLVEPGDWVMVQEHAYDGWAHGINLRTQVAGLFPLPVTVPHCGPQQRVVIVNCCKSPFDVFGQDVMNGALLAYPDNVSIYHCFSRGIPMGMPQDLVAQFAPGYIQTTRLEAMYLERAARDCRLDPNSQSQKVMVCGPKQLQGQVYDLLTSKLGMTHQSIRMMSPDSVE
ncbi:hypothetical protein EDD86DRAFT_192059 [Gorgonomyces haynaldii]|nr:hypothetical protein EDD86DRAFT_192059 [Gorgonomyces haynaldii]